MENDKEKKLIYSLLLEENLEAFYSSIRSELHVYKVEDLLHVTRKDLCRIGVLSGPDVRRFEKVILRVTKNAGFKGKFSKVLAKKPKQANVDLPATISLWEDFEPVIIKTEDLKLKDILGAGNFGEVFKGEWTRRLAGHETIIPVAVKCLKEESNKSFIKEVSVLSQLDQKHDNIVKLYGICIQEDRIRMVTEFAEEGSLLDKLRKGEIRSITLLCQFAVQIASGMMYLEKKGLVHRDLAARNILVTAHNQVKVSDFGLAKLVGQDKEWVMTSEEVLPIRWLGLESLLEGKFTSASDVWSFGVVLWELFSFGKHPYDGLNSFEVIEKLKKNERLQEPEYCPSKIYSLVMKRCWHENPDERMKFEDARSCLVSIHPTSSLAVSSQHYLDELKYAVGDIITAIKHFECQCGKCSTELLASAREYRCCREVHAAYGKVTFEGMQDTAPCVIDHPDYKAMVNKAVLLQVGPLLKGRNGKSYRRRPGVSLEEGAPDLWIGQNERTFEFGKYIKSQTRPLQSKIPFAATVALSPGYEENSLASKIQNGQPESQPISVPSTRHNARRSSEPQLAPEEPPSPTNVISSVEMDSPPPPLLPRSVDSIGDVRTEGNKQERPTNLPIPDKLAFGTLMRYHSTYVSMKSDEITLDPAVAKEDKVNSSHTRVDIDARPVPPPRPGKDTTPAKKHDRSPDVGSEASRLSQSLENSEVSQVPSQKRYSVELNPATVQKLALDRRPVPLPRLDKERVRMQNHERPSDAGGLSNGLSHAVRNPQVLQGSVRKRSSEKAPSVGLNCASPSSNSNKCTKPRPRSEIIVDNKHNVLSQKLSLGEKGAYNDRELQKETFASLISSEKTETSNSAIPSFPNSIKAYSSDERATRLTGNTSLTVVDHSANTKHEHDEGGKRKQSRPQKPPRLFKELQLEGGANELLTSAEGAASAEPFYVNSGVFDLDPSAWIPADQESVESHYDILWSASPLPGRSAGNSSENSRREMTHESDVMPISILNIHHKKQGSIERIQRLRKTQSLESLNLDQVKLEMATPLVTEDRPRSKSSYQPGLIGYSNGSFDIESEDDLKLDSSSDSVSYRKLENEAKDTGTRKKSTLFGLMRKKKSKKDRGSIDSALPIENLRELVKNVSQIIPSASEADISSALEVSRWSVDDTVKFLKVKQLVKLGLCPQSTCAEMLKTYDWNVLEASYAIKIHYLMAIHLELSIEEAAKLLRDNQWAIDRVLRVLRMPGFLEESEAIGFTSSEAEIILSSVDGDTEQALRELKVRRVVDVTQKSEDYCRKTLDHCQWKVDRAINFILEQG